MMRPIIFTFFAFMWIFLVAGCDNSNSKPELDPLEIVKETIRPSVKTALDVDYEIQKNLGKGRLKKENVIILKSNPPQYVVTGPRMIVEKLKRLASGEWLVIVLQPKTEATRHAVRLHIHKFTSSGDLQEEDVEEVVPGTSWKVIGPKEIIERLQKVASSE